MISEYFLIGIVLLVIGLVLAVLAMFIGGGSMKIAGVVGIVMLLIGIVFVGGYLVSPAPAQIASTSPPAQTAPTVSFKSLSGVTFESSSNVLKVTVVLNTTSGAIKTVSGVAGAKFSFNAVLSSLSNATQFETLAFAGNPTISNQTLASSNSFLYTDYSANSTMAADVSLPNGVVHNDISSSGASYLIPLKAAGVAQANFTFTLSGQGMMNLNANSGLGSIQNYSLTIAGQVFTVEVVLVNTVS